MNNPDLFLVNAKNDQSYINNQYRLAAIETLMTIVTNQLKY